MFDLLEKLFEAVATKVNPEKQMRNSHKKTLNTKLKGSTWSGEEDYYKFWLLSNGDIVPVESSHLESALDADLNHIDLMDAGALAGAILFRELSIDGSRYRKLTTKQISRLKNLQIEYKITELVVDAKTNFSTPVKSTKELAYYLEYGKESKSKFSLLDKLFEAVATQVVSPEKQMRKYYKNTINTKLAKSTWYMEKDYIKFWLLTNGDIVPVKSSHVETTEDAGVSHIELEKEGTFSGSVLGEQLNLGGARSSKLTSQQISRLKNICIEYDITHLHVYGGKHNFSADVKSSKEAAYYLEYGKEKWESKDNDVEEMLEKCLTFLKK